MFCAKSKWTLDIENLTSPSCNSFNVLLCSSTEAIRENALFFEDLPYFEFVIELVLYKALEASESDSTELQVLISFLKTHISFPKIIMYCARKIEASFWQKLFAISGPPEDIFEVGCLASQ